MWCETGKRILATKLQSMHRKAKYYREEATMDSQFLAVREAAKLCSPAPPLAARSGGLIWSVHKNLA